VLGSPETAAGDDCAGHQLLTVVVGAKETRKRVDLYDWFLPEPEKEKILAITVETP